MANEMGFFRQVKTSFLDFNSYGEFATQRSSKTHKYLFMLFTLIFVIVGIRTIYDVNTEINKFAAEQIPDFRLEDGRLDVFAEQPIILKNNRDTIIVDTTGKTNESVLDDYSRIVLITSDRMMVKENFQVKSVIFSQMKEVSLTKQMVVDFIPRLKIGLLIIMVVFGYIFGWIWSMFAAVILAIAGMLINVLIKGRLNFSSLWNIAVYALTLPWLLGMIKDVSYPPLPFFWFIKWGLAIFIMYKGVRAANVMLAEDNSSVIPSKSPFLPSSMACPECGKRVSDTDIFCPSCDGRLKPFQISQYRQSLHQNTSGYDGKAITAMILGLISLIAWIIPIVGLPISIIGLFKGAKGLSSSIRGVATTGLILCIIGLVASVGNLVLGIYVISMANSFN